MATHLKHLRRRLRRARKHLNEFERTATRFINSIHHEVVTEKDSDGVNQLLRIKVKGGKEPPLSLSLIAGDCIHNLRSILDNLIWQLGSLSGCSKTKLGDLAFPTRDFDAWKKKFNCLPQSAIDLIGSLQPDQPYKGRNDPDSHPLRILNRLWNDDKHRVPALMLTVHKSTGISPGVGAGQIVRLPDGRQVRRSIFTGHIAVHSGGRFQDGEEIATITFPIGNPEPQFKFVFSFDIGFDEGGPAKGKFASDCLRNLHDFVRDEVLTLFESIFPK